MADEWEQIDSGGWVDTGEVEPEREEAAPQEEASSLEAASSSGGDEWEQIDSGGWVDTGEVEPVPAAAAPKTSTLAKAAAAPKPAPSPGRGFFDTFFAGEFWSIGFLMVVLLLAGLTWYAYSSNNVGLTGIVVGVLIGFGFQKGRFCIYMAHREILLMKNWEMMKALILTILLIMVGYLFVSDQGIGLMSDVTDGTFTAISPRPAIWLAALVGGFIFGIGTVLAGGCAAGTTYRAGEGYIGNMVAVVTLMLGASIGMFGVLSPMIGELKKTAFKYTPLHASEPISNPTVYDILLKEFGISAWYTAAAIIFLVAIIWILKSGFSLPQIMPKGGFKLENIMKHKWTKWKAGVFIAFVVVGGLLTHSAAQALSGQGHNYSVCAACGLVRFTNNYFSTNGNLFEWSGLMMVGLVLGAFISAQFSGEFGLRVPEGKIILQAGLGGFLMGLGAVAALGCTVGHILSGAPALSIGSLIGWFSIAVGIMVTTYYMFMRDM
ncbi:MAG: YeeE/YedE family protein [Candidatus Altiarchaeota archaeon]|nr:YeeE/YedE family protein [Candidatus Altiarchaeota archaeon]